MYLNISANYPKERKRPVGVPSVSRKPNYIRLQKLTKVTFHVPLTSFGTSGKHVTLTTLIVYIVLLFLLTTVMTYAFVLRDSIIFTLPSSTLFPSTNIMYVFYIQTGCRRMQSMGLIIKSVFV